MELHYPTKNLSTIPDLSHATPFKTACKAVEQVIECEISGPEIMCYPRRNITQSSGW
jgi:hypothetical protein